MEQATILARSHGLPPCYIMQATDVMRKQVRGVRPAGSLRLGGGCRQVPGRDGSEGERCTGNTPREGDGTSVPVRFPRKLRQPGEKDVGGGGKGAGQAKGAGVDGGSCKGHSQRTHASSGEWQAVQ